LPRAGLYSYYIHQGNKIDKEREIVKKKMILMHTKDFFKDRGNSV
jgi:hypothetical protein